MVRTADEVDRESLDRFLMRIYRPEKAAFLQRHGDWWCRGQRNRWVFEDGGEVVAYCAIMPTRLAVGGEAVEAAWWIDLVVDPDHRGRGIQRMLDHEVRSAKPLVVGFPNAVAAKIHRHHGWGVREDYRVLLMPLRPREVGAVQRSRGWRGHGARMVAEVINPIAALMRRRLEGFTPRFSRRFDRVDPAMLSDIFVRRSQPDIVTTLRDETYLRWRFFEAPYCGDLAFFGTGRGNRVDLVAVTRKVEREGRIALRVLDLFGDLGDGTLVRDLILLVARSAVDLGVGQITIMATDLRLRRTLKKVGFIAGSISRFCWWSNDGGLMDRLGDARGSWCLADSDNDEP